MMLTPLLTTSAMRKHHKRKRGGPTDLPHGRVLQKSRELFDRMDELFPNYFRNGRQVGTEKKP